MMTAGTCCYKVICREFSSIEGLILLTKNRKTDVLNTVVHLNACWGKEFPVLVVDVEN